jgi:hypothetical protein
LYRRCASRSACHLLPFLFLLFASEDHLEHQIANRALGDHFSRPLSAHHSPTLGSGWGLHARVHPRCRAAAALLHHSSLRMSGWQNKFLHIADQALH